jgi:hypothetical protein
MLNRFIAPGRAKMATLRYVIFLGLVLGAVVLLPPRIAAAFYVDCTGGLPQCKPTLHAACSQLRLCGPHSNSFAYCAQWKCVPDVLPQCPPGYSYDTNVGNCCDTEPGARVCFSFATSTPHPPTQFWGCPTGYNYSTGAGLCCTFQGPTTVCFDYQGCQSGSYDNATGRCQ